MRCSSCGQLNPTGSAFCNSCGTRLASTLSAEPSATDAPLISPTTYVGRLPEQAELRAALQDTLSGRGRLVMLAGEPGIGKTRTAQELATMAETQGAQALWGRCYEEGGTPPYWPWLQALNSYISSHSPEQLQAEMGSGASAISEIVPDLRSRLPDIPSPPTMESEQARFRLFSSLSSFLSNVALSQPLLLVLDDLHWADRSSLLLLEFLAREIPASPLMLLGTYRDVEVSRRHPLSETLGSLIREQGFQRVQLSGLARTEVELLLRSLIGQISAPGLLTAVQQRTEGNPLFVGEIARMLARDGIREGQEVPTNITVNIPEGLRDAIGRRLNRLTEDCNRVLTMASVIGREFSLSLLNALVEDMAEDQLLQVLEEALAARVIEELPQMMGRYQFTHALIQETLKEEITTTRRVRLHARIAQILEALYESQTEVHATELAHHFAEAEAVLGTEKLVQYCLLAGEQALSAFAFEDALSHFKHGLSALNGQPINQQVAELWFGLGKSQAATAQVHELAEAVHSLTVAFEYFSESGDVQKAISVAEYPFHTNALRIPGAGDLISRALALLKADSQAAGRLLVNYGSALFFGKGDHKEAQSAFAQAMAIAQRENDLALEMKILTAEVQMVRGIPELYHEGVVKGLRAIDLAQETGDRYCELIAHYYTGQILRATGDSERSYEHARAALALAETLRDRYWLAGTLRGSQLECQLRGEWTAARAISDKALALSPTDPRVIRMRTMLEFQLGDFQSGERYLEQSIEIMRRSSARAGPQYTTPVQVLPRIALITGETERLSIADDAFASIASSPSGTPGGHAGSQGFKALSSIIRNDAESASENYVELLSYQGKMLGDIPRDRVLGLLAQTRGDLSIAAQHFQDALDFCRKSGYRPEIAWTCFDYANTLLRHGSPVAVENARSLFEESLAISSELGMVPLMERVQSRLQGLGAIPPSHPDGLTSREVQVLNLIALGKSNRAIGQELVISEGTVRRHINNIYNKIGVVNRAEATRYSLEKGLTSSG